MFNLVNEGGDKLVSFLNDQISRKNQYTIEAMDLANKYTIYNVASCTLGIDPKTFNEEDSEMRLMGRGILEPTFYNGLKQFLIFILPDLAHFLSV